jgi:iron complex outermembrane receptor protein
MGSRHRRQCAGAAAAIGALLATASAAAERPSADRLTDLSLEELSNIEITSVSKRSERLSDAPTSVFVITGDDIRRSGATSLPEALRLAPTLQVARAGANGWAISARGFNSAAANKRRMIESCFMDDGRTCRDCRRRLSAPHPARPGSAACLI